MFSYITLSSSSDQQSRISKEELFTVLYTVSVEGPTPREKSVINPNVAHAVVIAHHAGTGFVVASYNSP